MFDGSSLTLINDKGYMAELTNFEFHAGNKIRIFVTLSDPNGNVILVEPSFEISGSKIMAWLKGMSKLDSWNQKGRASGKEILKPFFDEMKAVFDLLLIDKLPRKGTGDQSVRVKL